MFGIRALGQLLDQPLFEQPPNRGVKAAGAEAEGSARALDDVLHYRVAVSVTIGKRDEDVEGIPMQWEKRLGGFGLSGSGRHEPNYIINGYIRYWSIADPREASFTRRTPT